MPPIDPMANLLTFSRQDLVFRYGTPVFENDPGGSGYLYFSNGILAMLEADKVRAYGVYSHLRE